MWHMCIHQKRADLTNKMCQALFRDFAQCFDMLYYTNLALHSLKAKLLEHGALL